MDETHVDGIKVPQYSKNIPLAFKPNVVGGFVVFGALVGMAAYAWTSYVEGRIYSIVNEDLRDAFVNGHWEAE